MTGKGHFATGIACSLIAFDLTNTLNGFGLLGSVGLILGVNAPDYLEIRRRKYNSGGVCVGTYTKIKHRTITHTLSLWVIFMLFCLANLPYFNSNLGNNSDFFQFLNISNYMNNYDFIGYYLFSFLFGYSMGALLHLLTDIPNPMGIPIFLKKRYSLNLWKSGKNESIIIAFFVLLNLFYFDIIKINGETINNIKDFFI